MTLQNPWDVYPSPQKTEDFSDLPNLTQAIGTALSFWEHLENAQAGLFQATVPGRGRSSFHAYCAAESSTVRISMIEASAEAALASHPELLAKIKDHLRLVRKFSARRNEIAHGLIFAIAKGNFQLGPNLIKMNKWKNNTATFQYAAPAVLYYAAQFLILHESVFRLLTELKTIWPDIQIPAKLLKSEELVSILNLPS